MREDPTIYECKNCKFYNELPIRHDSHYVYKLNEKSHSGYMHDNELILPICTKFANRLTTTRCKLYISFDEDIK